MTVYASLDQALDTIEKSSTEGDIWTTLFSYLKLCRARAVQYHHLPSAGAADFAKKSSLKHFFDTTDDDIKETMNNLFSKLSPEKIALGAMKDHQWSFANGTLTPVVQTRVIAPKADQLSGISFTVHGPLGRSGYFTLVSGIGGEDFSDDEIRLMKWVCQNTHQALCKIKVRALQESISLTEREIEILSWIARGKSNSVIAEILGISPHTVNTYVRRIFLKTGTNDRTSACLYGISNGLVSL
ncbi:response regulator transcription factor [Hellea balneolensis]|uniref:response regulator transcription factor n=1 Tax=Hellea balneolensis TaxID=287478 RepID=UPI0004001F44|nr:helix-turn-helix transcriptional regulator [Hellea balneolensis]